MSEILPKKDVIARGASRKAGLDVNRHLDDPIEDDPEVRMSQQSETRPLVDYSDVPFWKFPPKMRMRLPHSLFPIHRRIWNFPWRIQLELMHQ